MSFKPSATPMQFGKCADVREIEPSLAGAGLRVGIAMARFNRDVGEGLLSGCCQELRRLGVAPECVTLATVPGALEIPAAIAIALDAAEKNGKPYDAAIALGCVVRGGNSARAANDGAERQVRRAGGARLRHPRRDLSFRDRRQ